MADYTWTTGFRSMTGFAPFPGLGDPCGAPGGGIGNIGQPTPCSGDPLPSPTVGDTPPPFDTVGRPNATCPATITLLTDLQTPAEVAGLCLRIGYAGALTLAVDASADGVVWTEVVVEVAPTPFPDHLGVPQVEDACLTLPETTARFFRFSLADDASVADAPSRLELNRIGLRNAGGVPLGQSGGYCGQTGTFILSGHYIRTLGGAPPHEQVDLTLFYKQCCSPRLTPCAHGTGLRIAVGVYLPASYCSDGKIAAVSTRTDCDGAYTLSASGSLLGAALAIGKWIPKPDFTCASPPGTPAYILDPATEPRYRCGPDLGGPSGTALSIGSFSNAGGLGLNDMADPFSQACGFGGEVPGCAPCQFTTGGIWKSNFLGVTADASGTIVANTLQGAYTLDFHDAFYEAAIVAYYTKNGKWYQVGGVNVHLTDACNRTETVNTASYPGASQIAVVDWPNLVSVTLSGWTADCDPPLYQPFPGPEGTLFVSGPFDGPPLFVIPPVGLFPHMPDLTAFCIDAAMRFGVEVQPPCTGTEPDRLQADCTHDILALAWVTGGLALKTACHRAPTRSIGNGATGWEPTASVEAAGADDLGLLFLPNEGLYLTYQRAGQPVYRINRSFGAADAWDLPQTPTPAVSRHSAGGRGQEQAFRFRALGDQSANGPLQFSQCRDNRGALWTDPTLVTANAQGPYCGGVWTGAAYLSLFSLAVSIAGVGAANDLMVTESVDGGQTWSVPVRTGFTGQCNGIVRTDSGILVALVWNPNGNHGTAFLQSRDRRSWVQEVRPGRAVPLLTRPPVLAALGDTVFVLWITDDQPQFLASLDGGASWR